MLEKGLESLPLTAHPTCEMITLASALTPQEIVSLGEDLIFGGDFSVQE